MVGRRHPFIGSGNGLQAASVSRVGINWDNRRDVNNGSVQTMGQTGTGAENTREAMSHITAVNWVLVKILLEQLHSNTVFLDKKETKVLRSGGDISCFLHLLFGCFLAPVLVCGCYCFSCMLGQLILPLINIHCSHPGFHPGRAAQVFLFTASFHQYMCSQQQGGN